MNDRINKIIIEASEQSERGKLLKILETQSFESDFKNIDKIYIADSFNKNLEHLSITANKHHINSKIIVNNIGLIIWPEWGFSEDEVSIMNKNWAISVSLWKRILRTETAVISWLSLLNN